MSTPTTGARGGVLPLVERRRQFVTQQSTVWARKQHAVCVRRACKKYGSGKSPNVILNNLNMTVPKGCIYGLLGASGCGKTTLLSCIVGRRRLNSGEIWVLGGKPGSKGSGVPGPRIGYMPQEIALYGEFTIRETLVYFGWVNGMSTADVDAKVDFFINFLQLPDASRRVKNLSGGQQRRVSFAAAMVHEPELLILDEPTVGVDPVLRQSIWDHLVNITSELGTTVIITTHYIDETRQAHTIGLMRGGSFLAEESPNSIMARYHSISLEDAFLKLSVIQNRGKRRRSSILSEITAATEATIPEIGGMVNQSYDDSSEISGEFGESMTITTKRTIPLNQNADPLPPEDDVKWTWSDYFSIFSSNHMKALVWKNTLWMVRNIGLMLFIIGLPVAQIVLFCLSIGRDPRGLRLAVVNHELDQPMSPCTFNLTCNYERFSCRYLTYLSQRHHSVVSYADKESAYAAVKGGHAWGMITFPANFSQNLEIRVNDGRSAEDSVLEDSEIDVQLDMSNDQIAFMLKRDLVFAFQDFTRDVAISCEVNPAVIKTPLRFHLPVYGPVVPNFTDFAAPGVILTIIFFLAVALTSGAMLIERNEGLLERGLVSGITGLEILAAHVITQFVVMLGQSVMVVVFALVVFDITNQGKVYWVLLLIILCGTCGMTFGFVVSCVTDSERNATYLALGSFLPFVMLCGVIWPVQGMHAVLRTVSYFLPLTLSTESLRNILARGWSIDEPTVYAGFISTVVWIFVLLNISVLLIKFRKG